MTGAALAAYAANPVDSRGRRYPEPPPAYRSEYQRDRDRVIHCGAFRRLEYKTQVFVNHEGDLFRTRLTHSIEVAQIGRAIARALQLNEDLTEAIALAHDLGHTPFGHTGQDALNECMGEFGGFEHNLQSLRVVDVLEERYAEFSGLNLTFEAREGILKHCSLKNAQQLGELGERFLHKRQPGLEAQLANLADEIAYNNHDVDDGLRSGLLTLNQLHDVPLFSGQYRQVMQRYPDLAERRAVHETIRAMIGRVVTDLIETTRSNIAAAGVGSIDEVRLYARPLVAYSDTVRNETQELKRFLRRHLYAHAQVKEVSAIAARTVRDLFDTYMGDPRGMPPQYAEQSARAESRSGAAGRARVVADYIAGMTDRYAIGEHARLFGSSAWPRPAHGPSPKRHN